MLVEGIRSATSYQPPAINPAAARVESAPSEAPRSVQLPYISPVLSYDSDAAIAVLQFRNSESGDVETQYPSERVVREYQLRGRDKMGAALDTAQDRATASSPGDTDATGSAPAPVPASVVGNGTSPSSGSTGGATSAAAAPAPVNVVA